MSALLATAPALVAWSDQAWSDQIELAKARSGTLAWVREKIPFEVTPSFPLMYRTPEPGADRVASGISIEFAREPARPSLSS